MLLARATLARLRSPLPQLLLQRLSRTSRLMAVSAKEAIVSVSEVHATRWLRLNSIRYTDAAGVERAWDACERTTRNASGSADAVVVFTVLRRAGTAPHTLLVRQFRPPMAGLTLELPAGLIDPGESPAVAALRELKEETGYTATIRSVSPAACMSPGLTNESVHLVYADIDLDAAENLKPAQAADDAGNIDVLTVALSDLRATLDAHSAAGGTVYAGLWTLVAGMEAAS